LKLPLYQVDAFGGNSACIIPLKNWLTDKTLLKIENIFNWKLVDRIKTTANSVYKT